MNTKILQTGFLPRTVSVSDLQKKTKNIFADMTEQDSPTLVLNRNEKVGVLLKPKIYEELMEVYEDYLDGLELAKAVENSSAADMVPWEKVRKKLQKEGRLS